MSNESRIINDLTQLAVGDFSTNLSLTSPATAGRFFRGTPQQFQMNAASVAASGSARQSAKIDFGNSRGVIYLVRATIKFAAVVGAGDSVDFYIAPSSDGTPGNGNVGNTDGTDSAFTVEDSYLAQMTRVGSLVCDDALAIQSGVIGFYQPSLQYGNLVVVNNASQNFHATPDELHVVLDAVSYGT